MTEFAWKHMEQHGWVKGEGLGRSGQGMVDALKPKLKFDQAGMGLDRAAEFEFQWWDHVFNSAAQGVTVNESKGEVTVEFKADKSEISSKKMRRRMQKEIRNKLYSHFVKSGTMEGGKFTQEENDNCFEEVKDLSKIKTMTDEQLVKACGGRTAHKGARYGHNMSAKLKRIEDAENKYMEELLASQKDKELKKKEATAKKAKEVEARLNASIPSTAETISQPEVRKKKKKKKSSKEKEDLPEPEVEKELSPSPEVAVNSETPKKSKKRKRGKEIEISEPSNIQSEDVPQNLENINNDVEMKSKKSKKKKKCTLLD